MIRNLTWKSTSLLSCAQCAPADVILCVDSNKVAPILCPEQSVNQQFSYSTIEGQILSYRRSNIIDPPKWAYSLSYDDDQLVSGATLAEADISGIFCDGCFAQWVRDLVGNEPHIEEVAEDSYVFVSQHDCRYPFSTGEGGVSPALDYIFGDGSDGTLTVMAAQQLILPTDRDYYYEDVTIEAGGELVLAAPTYGNYYKLHVRGTLTVDGLLISDGEDAPNASGSVQTTDECGSNSGGVYGHGQEGLIAGPTNPFKLDEGSYGPGGGDDAGGCGGRGATSALSSQTGDESQANLAPGAGYMAGGHGGAGGDGGGGSAGGAGSGETVFGCEVAGGLPWKEERFVWGLYTYGSAGSYSYNTIGGGAGGAGGGGGGRSGGTSAGGMGGGGGAGAGSMYVAARSISVANGARISADGGDGGDGANGSIGTGAGAGGGGGGGAGGGGMIHLIYENLVNNGIIRAVGGSGGSGGSGAGTLSAGTNGEDGLDGVIHLLNMTTGVMDTP